MKHPRWMTAALATLALLSLAGPAAAEDGLAPGVLTTPDPPAPPASAEAGVLDLTLRETGAQRGIPWAQLDPTAYELVRDVVGSNAMVSREVRHIAFRSRRPIFEFLLDHPDFAAEVARAVRQGKYRLRRAGDVYEADDGQGAHGTLRPLFVDGGRRMFYLEGRYDVPLLPTLAGRMVLLLDAEHLDGPDGVTYCELSLSGYVRLDSGLTERIVSRSLSESRVDRKVRRFFRHVAALSRRAYDDPEGLADELAGRPDLPADHLARFRHLLLAHLPPAWSQPEQFHLLDSAALLAGEE